MSWEGHSHSDPATRLARTSATAFGAGGVALVLGGMASIATGTPDRAYGLAPLAGIGDVFGRAGELTPLIAAIVAALVAASVVAQLALRRSSPPSAASELVVLGAAVLVCVAGSIGRLGYSLDGGVLEAGVACLTGGVALVAAGAVAFLVRE